MLFILFHSLRSIRFCFWAGIVGNCSIYSIRIGRTLKERLGRDKKGSDRRGREDSAGEGRGSEVKVGSSKTSNSRLFNRKTRPSATQAISFTEFPDIV